jgi:hypothetical protein
MAGKQKNKKLTPAEQKTTAAYKLLSEQNETLKKSLASTQDELENYRSKYHEADKSHAVLSSKTETFILHEILKFLFSCVGVAVGVNFLTDGKISYGILAIVFGVGLYSLIVYLDNK